MPELPELQALAERLEELLGGHTLRRADILHFSALKTVSPTPGELVGRPLESAARRGKYLSLGFGDVEVVVHLSQGGRIDVEQPAKHSKPRGALMRLGFEGDVSVLLREHGTERKAAWWLLPAGTPGPREGLGPEPFEEEFAAYLLGSDDRRQLHTVLRDQRTVAGIGRGFADDILHRACLSPLAPLNKLTDDERRRLLHATRAVLDDALAEERERSGGLTGALGDRFAVHGRHGAPCPRCGETLRRVSYGSREVVYCRACQTEGKILADRRLSRLLR